MSMQRRQFLLLTGSATAVYFTQRSVESAEYGERLVRVEQTARALGTNVSITALHDKKEVAQSAVREAFAELERVENLMSIYRPESEVSRLNRNGYLDQAHPDLLEVLASAADFSRRSEGAFDITVQPLWELYQQANRRNALPNEESLEPARQCVDWRRVEVTGDRVRLLGKKTQITLNGIAQGFAADKVSAALRRCGVVHALIDTGEMVGRGSNANDQPWRIGIQHPRHGDAYLAVAKLKNRCLSTSGDYSTKFTTDFRHHHIFDPRTGRSPVQLASVSVVANTAMQADALSTALFVLGLDRGIKFLQSMPGCDALIATKEGSVRATNGFPWETT